MTLDFDNLTPEQKVAAIHRGRLEHAKQAAREGDVEDFIRFQWPHLWIDSAEEASLFGRDLRIDDFQWDILRHVFDPAHTECFIKGCTKPGKGFAVSLAVNIWFDIWDEARVILTGPTADHAQTVIFAEVKDLRAKMRMPVSYEPMNAELRAKDNPLKHYMRIANPKSGEGFSGQHGPRTLFVFDESSATADDLYDNAKKQARFIIALSNPRTLSGWFRTGFGESNPDETRSVQTPFGKRHLVTVGGEHCMNVRLKRLEKPFAPKGGLKIRGQEFAEGEHIPPEFYMDVKPLIPNQLDYARYLDIMSHPEEFHRSVFGKGEFPREDMDLQVILSSWLPSHKAAWNDELPVECSGLDVAASEDGDESMLAMGGSLGCRKLHPSQKSDVMVTTGWVLNVHLNEYGIDLREGNHPIAIDYGGGYGRAVGDRLKEQGVCVIECHPSKRAMHPEQYENTRAEMYGMLGGRLDPNGAFKGIPWALPNDSKLDDELVAPEKIRASDGIKYRLIPKDKPNPGYTGKTIKGKIGRSPDRADAVALLYMAVRRMESALDVSERSLLHDLREPEEQGPMSYQQIRDQEIERLCKIADEMAESDSFGLGW